MTKVGGNSGRYQNWPMVQRGFERAVLGEFLGGAGSRDPGRDPRRACSLPHTDVVSQAPVTEEVDHDRVCSTTTPADAAAGDERVSAAAAGKREVKRDVCRA